MENREVKLSVKNLKISFRTDGGKVQAVRDINFDLYKGETLAIVGESGSGKSVTSRAVLGILANNAIKEGGEILYDGQDLMKISEEEFCKIRGDKIAMIFQDPLSSLNPIMRVGKQMTEAMLINGKINQKNCRRDFNTTLALLNDNMDKALGANDENIKARNKQLCRDFDRFECKHLELENAYLLAREACIEAIDAIDDALFRIEKHASDGLKEDLDEIVGNSKKSVSRYVVHSRADELNALVSRLEELIKVPFKKQVTDFVKRVIKRGTVTDDVDYAAVSEVIVKIKDILAEATGYVMPNFFAMGYYLTFSQDPLPDMPIDELNVFLRKYLDDKFMLEFIRIAEEGMRYSAAQSLEHKKSAIAVLDEQVNLFNDKLEKNTAREAVKALVSAVESGIDRLDIVKDNVAYTFRSSVKAAVESYFDGIIRNRKEEKRYARQKASYDKKVAAGKPPQWTLVDKNLVDLASVRGDIIALIDRVKSRFINYIDGYQSIDFDAKAVDMIDYLKAKASGVAHKVTHSVAKTRALKLMEEVGIPEPRKRYRQYPFEFSGGMRQRVVIAIALSADPDILICDEPTTALDVTIQSQILELINKVKSERNLSVVFITHDLGVVANMADRVAVMYAGKIVEIGSAKDIFYSPAHPYTWALLSSMPDLDTKEKLEAIPGTPPNMIYPPKGDAFAERNKYAMQIDFEEQPPMFKISDSHYAATWLLHPNAPKIDPPKAVTDRIKRMRVRGGENVKNVSEQAATVDEEEPESQEEGDTPEKKPVAKKTATAKKTKANGASDKSVPTAKKTATAKKTTAADKPATKKPATKKPATKKPAAKKPATKKTTVKKDGGEK